MKKLMLLLLVIILTLVNMALFAESRNHFRKMSRDGFRDIPDLVNYQGRLTDETGQAIDGIVSITFSIYADSTGGVALWTETQSEVQVMNGLFHVLLGSETFFPGDLFGDPERWIGIEVNSDGEMEPRSRIASVPYAIQSSYSNEWSIEGDDIYRLEGNVGFGVSNPEYKLDVAGDINFEGEIYQGSL